MGYGLLALLIIAAAAYCTHRLDAAHYEALQAAYTRYQAQVQADAASAQEAARNALQAQIDAKTAQEARNAKIIANLEDRASAAERNAAFAERLLAAARAAGTAAPGHSVPAAHDQPGAPGTPGHGGDQPAFDLLGTTTLAAGECRDAIERLQALQAEIAPQVSP